MRSQPIGRDKDGYVYWFFMDKDYSIRLFNQNSTDLESTWKIVAKEVTELKDLIEKWSSDPALVKLKSSKRYLENLEKENKEKEILELKAKEEGLKNVDNKDISIEDKPKEIFEDKPEVKKENEEKTEEIKNAVKVEEESVETKTEEVFTEEKNESVKEEIKQEIQENGVEEQEPNKHEITKNDEEEEQEIEIESKAFKSKKEESNEKKTAELIEALEDGPIALRKSTRSSARKAQEAAAAQLKTTPHKKQQATPIKTNEAK